MKSLCETPLYLCAVLICERAFADVHEVIKNRFYADCLKFFQNVTLTMCEVDEDELINVLDDDFETYVRVRFGQKMINLCEKSLIAYS